MENYTTSMEVFNVFLKSIRDYDLVDFTEEDLKEEFALNLFVVVAKATELEELSFDMETHLFNRKLSPLEIVIMARGLVVEWLNPIILEANAQDEKMLNMGIFLTSADYKAVNLFGEKAKKKDMWIDIKDKAEKEFYYLMKQMSHKKMLKTYKG